MKKSNFKHDRLESIILDILNQTRLEEIYDQIIKLSTFTTVKLTNDNSFAKVFVDTFDRSKVGIVVSKLNEASGVFRKALSKELTIHKTPKVIFVPDETIDQAAKIDNIINKIHNK